jgi:hypothetical protein
LRTGTEAYKKMLLRLLRSTLVGVGAASCTAALLLTVLWIYIRFFWVKAHSGVGAVVGGIYPVLYLMPTVFVAGFVLDWRQSRKK